MIVAIVTSGETAHPSSVPLVACGSYFSIWSPVDELTDAYTMHWTGKAQRLTSLVRIDEIFSTFATFSLPVWLCFESISDTVRKA